MEIPSFTFLFCICNKSHYIIGNFPFPGVNYILHDKYLFQLFNDMYMLLSYILSSHYDIHLWNCCVIISFHGWSIFYGSWRCNFVKKKKKPFGTKIIMCLLISWHKRGQWYLWKVNHHGFLWFHINVDVILTHTSSVAIPPLPTTITLLAVESRFWNSCWLQKGKIS